MLYIIQKLNKNKILLSLLLVLGYNSISNAQITGTNPVAAGSTHTYNFFNDTGYPFIVFTVTGGTILNTGTEGSNNYWVDVQWDSTPGDWVLTCRYGKFIIETLTVTDALPAPAVPAMPTITNYPGYTRLTRGTPPGGETWYWQDAVGNESILNSSTSVTMTSGTEYYLKSYNSITDMWSAALTINYTIDPSTTLSDENYIYTITPRAPTTNVSGLTIDEKNENVTYFDGLGRPMQSVGIRTGGNREDIITHIEYDVYGRQVKDYLPYSSDVGISSYRTSALGANNSFYDATKYETDFPSVAVNDINAYSQKELEASPLNRVLKQAAPGKDWKLGAGNEIAFDYQTNTGSEVRRYEANTTVSVSSNVITYIPTLSLDTSTGNNNGYYEAYELYKTITKDENHDGTSSKAHTTEEFKDKQGRVMLKRTYAAIGSPSVVEAHNTYYVYDDYGNLSYVLPPKVNADDNIPTGAELNDLCYQYKYDDRNRLVEKKIPGKGWEYIVYNKLDQPIMTQDAIQNAKSTKEWLFTKYDAFGRVAYTGLTTNNSSRSTIQSTVNGISTQWVTKSTTANTIDGTTIYYDNGAYPTTIADIYTINYYDNYTFDGFTSMPSSSQGQPIINYSNSSGTQKLTKGLATGSKVRVLDTNPVKWITTTMGYDEKGRSIYVKSVNAYLSTTDIVQSQLDFTGAVTKTETSHVKGSTNVITEDLFTYDHVGRLTKQTQELNNTNVLEVIAENNYDELGQLERKDVGGKTTQSRLQNVDYTYNVRGWLKQINNPTTLGNDLFAFEINYNQNAEGTAYSPALYNGNISQTIWATANDNTKRANAYKYDALNRITDSYFRKADGSGVLNQEAGRYELYGVTYDKNGNINNLKRNGHINSGATSFGQMDNLTYDYGISGANQLYKVRDDANDTYGFKDSNIDDQDYWYDANGNMTRDDNKGITNIIYNYLNLPTNVALGGGNISYFYDATGVKLKKIVSNTGSTTEYAGNYVYEDSSLKFFNHPEGYVEPKDASNYALGFNYAYQYKDHLGNIRLSYMDSDGNGSITASTEILEENNYYPFGLKHKGYNNNPVTNHKYELYNGVEYEESLGLNLYEMDVRSYDPAIARFTSIDPVTHNSMSTYTAFDNNPVFFADPSGADAESGRMDLASTFVDIGGKVVEHRDDGDNNVYLVGDGWDGTKDGLPIVGKEDPNRNYKKGDQYIYHNGFIGYNWGGLGTNIDMAGLVTDQLKIAATVTVIPVYDESGRVVGMWKSFKKVPFKALKIVNGVLKPLGTSVAAINFGVNTYQVATGQMSVGRYSFNTIGTAGSMYAASAYGGPVGVAIGGVVYLGDVFIQANEFSTKLRKSAYEGSRYKIIIPDNIKWYEFGKMWNSIMSSSSRFIPH